jgi:hypothetical protein
VNSIPATVAPLGISRSLMSRSLVVAAWGTIVFSCIGVSAAQNAQISGIPPPCGGAQAKAPFPGTNGLFVVNGGPIYTEWTVYDSNLGVCWLADGNLAGDPAVVALIKPSMTTVNADGSAPVINPDGTMDYETALNWIAALNLYNSGNGWLNHNNWQLPATPQEDLTCSSQNGINFGVLCTGSALGNLYNVGLKQVYPNSVVPFFYSLVFPFIDLQPGLYWTSDENTGGQVTFSFNNLQQGANTTKYNFYHVLTMTKSALGPLPKGTGVLPYTAGAGRGKAVYDTNTGISWIEDANLPSENKFGVTGTTTISSDVDGSVLTVPLVDNLGDVYFTAIDPSAKTGWIVSMNKSKYAGTNTWKLPQVADLVQLSEDMGLKAGDARLEWPFLAGPFLFFQPGFYWSCARDPDTSLNAPCDPSISLGTSTGANPVPMEFSFNFDDGFQGTDENTKQFYVTAYYPAP